MALDAYTPPANYDELMENYHEYTVGLVQKFGIPAAHSKDVAQSILLRFFERDFLAKFDPNHEVVYKGEKRPARFQSFLNAFVQAYCRGHRDRVMKQRQREPLICDAPVGDGSSTWIEVFGESDDALSVDLGFTEVEYASLVDSIRKYLSQLPAWYENDPAPLAELFDAIVQQVQDTPLKRVDIADLQAVFGVSSTAIHTRMKNLRQAIARYLERAEDD